MIRPSIKLRFINCNRGRLCALSPHMLHPSRRPLFFHVIKVSCLPQKVPKMLDNAHNRSLLNLFILTMTKTYIDNVFKLTVLLQQKVILQMAVLGQHSNLNFIGISIFSVLFPLKGFQFSFSLKNSRVNCTKMYKAFKISSQQFFHVIIKQSTSLSSHNIHLVCSCK